MKGLKVANIQNKQIRRRVNTMSFIEKILPAFCQPTSVGPVAHSRRPVRKLALTALLGGAVLAGIVGAGGATGHAAAPTSSGDLDTTFGSGGGIAFDFGGSDD